MADPARDTAAMAELARRTLLEEVLPHVPPSCRYQTLMVANALGIAARELLTGAERDAAEAADARSLLGTAGTDGTPADLRHDLAAAIRKGALDDEPALVPLLRRQVAAALAISNPKHTARNDKTHNDKK